jgi:molybdate transport system substrate-binding protein
MRRASILLLSFGVMTVAGAQSVRVAAAANLKFVLEDIRSLYVVAHPDAQIVMTFGSSGALCQQILNGAPFDLFLSADRTYPDRLAKEKATVGEIRTYAIGRLVLWSTTLDLAKGIGAVDDSSVKTIVVAKPEVAPYGERAIQCLKYYEYYNRVQSKLVYADNISQAAQYVATGNADAGFVPLSLILAPGLNGRGFYVVLDEKSYIPVEQACVLIASQKPNAEASRFMDFLTGPVCRSLFQTHGYTIPASSSQ